MYSLVNRAAIGSIIGARVAYVINHPGDFSNPLEIFAVWKGGISLLGGISGAVLAGVPKMRSEGLSFWKVMDLAVPCVAMGIIVGRIGDLVIADHLGKPTDFFLGYVCPSKVTGSPCLAPIGQAVHQPALYDFFSATLLLIVLMRLRRTIRYDGFLTLFFGAWYGTGRFMEDFFRIDETHGTGLTGSQWTAVTVLASACSAWSCSGTPPGRAARASSPRSRPGIEQADEPAPEEPEEQPVPDDGSAGGRRRVEFGPHQRPAHGGIGGHGSENRRGLLGQGALGGARRARPTRSSARSRTRSKGGAPVIWLTDKKGRRVGIPTDKIAYIEVAEEDAGEAGRVRARLNRLPVRTPDLLGRRLLFFTGKGGVGKSTVSAAMALLAAEQGQRVLLVSADGRGDIAAFFEKPPGRASGPRPSSPGCRPWPWTPRPPSRSTSG